MGTSQIVTLPILTKLAANFKMAATTRFAKLFSGKRKAVEEGLYSFKRLNDEMANKCFTEELTFETEVAQAAGLAAVLLNKKPREERLVKMNSGTTPGGLKVIEIGTMRLLRIIHGSSSVKTNCRDSSSGRMIRLKARIYTQTNYEFLVELLIRFEQNKF